MHQLSVWGRIRYHHFRAYCIQLEASNARFSGLIMTMLGGLHHHYVRLGFRYPHTPKSLRVRRKELSPHRGLTVPSESRPDRFSRHPLLECRDTGGDVCGLIPT